MKRFSLLVALALAVSIPALAQSSIEAPAGWKTQPRAGGAMTFTPPDLQAGEVFSVTVYDGKPLGGKTPEAWLRAFAGPVGSQPGQLSAPLQIVKSLENLVVSLGVYRGPNGAKLNVIFFGVSSQGGKISLERTLFSGNGDELPVRYKDETREILNSLKAVAQGEAHGEAQSEAQSEAKREAKRETTLVPEAIFDSMKRGGAIVPGIYRGTRTLRGGTSWELSVDLYGNGEYRILRTAGAKVLEGYDAQTGAYDYEARSGKIDIGSSRHLTNRVSVFGNRYSFFGRDAAGKPWIYAEDEGDITTLRYVGPPTKRLAPRAEDARQAAIRAEEDRYKWVVAPGKGLKAAQIAAVWWDQVVNSDGMNVSKTNTAYLLLKDGTIRRGLPVAFDEMNVALSRQKEPEEWGRWRKIAGKTQVSWGGGPFEILKGFSAVAGAAGARVAGRYGSERSSYHGTGSSFSFWGVTFSKAGRFSKDSSGSSASTIGVGEGSVTVQSGSNNGESYAGASGGGVAVGSIRKKNPNGDREGTYSINGYTMTLRYDNGTVERMPFFFSGQGREQVWFEGGLLLGGS